MMLHPPSTLAFIAICILFAFIDWGKKSGNNRRTLFIETTPTNSQSSRNSLGFIYGEIYRDSNCATVVDSIVGYATDVCVPIMDVLTGTVGGSVVATCGVEQTITQFSSTNCDPSTMLTEGPILLSSCGQYDGGKSIRIQCKAGEELPHERDSIVKFVYSSMRSCSTGDSPILFEANSVDSCEHRGVFDESITSGHSSADIGTCVDVKLVESPDTTHMMPASKVECRKGKPLKEKSVITPLWLVHHYIESNSADASIVHPDVARALSWGSPTPMPIANALMPENVGVPTELPTIGSPTLVPTHPTPAPSDQTSEIVTFTIRITISNILSSSLSASAQLAVAEATAKSMGAHTINVKFVSSISLSGSESGRSSGSSKSSAVTRPGSGYGSPSVDPPAMDVEPMVTTSGGNVTVEALTLFTAPMSAYAQYSSPLMLYQAMSSAAYAAAQSQAFTSNLHNASIVFNSSDTLGATVVDVSTYGFTVIGAPTMTPTSKPTAISTGAPPTVPTAAPTFSVKEVEAVVLSFAAIIVIVVVIPCCGCVCGAIAIYFLYTLCCRDRASGGPPKVEYKPADRHPLDDDDEFDWGVHHSSFNRTDAGFVSPQVWDAAGQQQQQQQEQQQQAETI